MTPQGLLPRAKGAFTVAAASAASRARRAFCFSLVRSGRRLRRYRFRRCAGVMALRPIGLRPMAMASHSVTPIVTISRGGPVREGGGGIAVQKGIAPLTAMGQRAQCREIRTEVRHARVA